MRDYESEQQAPSERRLKPASHGPPSVADKQVSEKPPTVRQSHVQPRRKGAISPPPLKRQRTTYDKPSSSFSGRMTTAPTVQSNREPDIISASKSFPAPTARRRHDSRYTHYASGRRHVSSSVPKPTCLFCDKSSATSYNPIVACPGCSKPYHDSCRTPPLAPDIQP
jgi:hypothetical protein